VRAPRMDDCLAAAVATCLQVPIEDVPDPRIDERRGDGEDPESIDTSIWEQLDSWLETRGLQVVVNDVVPVRGRWIGIVPLEGWFNSHSMVMVDDHILFDPTTEIGARAGTPLRVFSASDVAVGLSFGPRPRTRKR
jgi:hypothetical protein